MSRSNNAAVASRSSRLVFGTIASYGQPNLATIHNCYGNVMFVSIAQNIPLPTISMVGQRGQSDVIDGHFFGAAVVAPMIYEYRLLKDIKTCRTYIY